MRRHVAIEVAALALGLAALTVGVFAQQAPAGRGAAPEGRGAAAAPARGPAAVRPPTFFREEWKQPPYTGQLNDPARRLTQEAVTNPNLELKVYGPCKDSTLGVEVYGTPKDTVFPMNLWTGSGRATPMAWGRRSRIPPRPSAFSTPSPRAGRTARPLSFLEYPIRTGSPVTARSLMPED